MADRGDPRGQPRSVTILQQGPARSMGGQAWTKAAAKKSRGAGKTQRARPPPPPPPPPHATGLHGDHAPVDTSFYTLSIPIIDGLSELSTGRMDPRIGSGHDLPDFGGSGRVGPALRILQFFTGYFLVPKSIRIFECYIRID